jgi:hypothetical protein
LKKSYPFGRWFDYLIGISIESSYVIVLSVVALIIIFVLFKFHSLGWF